MSIGLGRPHKSLVDLRQSYYEASYAIRIRKLKGGSGVIASFGDLGSYGLLLGLQDTLSLQVFYDSVLGKLHEYDEQNSSDLVKSLACFLEANGHWGEAAERLYVHRHTLRYRMKRVEEITSRDLGRRRTAWSSGWPSRPGTHRPVNQEAEGAARGVAAARAALALDHARPRRARRRGPR